MTVIVFDVAQFRMDFPAFADDVKYPDDLLHGYFDAATCFISAEDCGDLHGDCRVRALYLLTAHLTHLGVLMASGQAAGGVTTSASVGAVSVSTMPPPATTAFKYWLFSTPYGAQLAALLGAKSAGGFFVGGLSERKAFRKVGGTFW